MYRHTAPTPPARKWRWHPVLANQPSVGGDLAKVFRNETVKAPGVFAHDKPSDPASLLAREAIQNAWDAALEARQALRSEAVRPFQVRFRFVAAAGPRRDSLVGALGLSELAERAAAVGDRPKLGLDAHDCLSGLGEGGELRLLEIYETAGGGMHGPWEGKKSKLWLALCSSGYTDKPLGGGGSYGYGKAGLIRASAIRQVIAYTCHEARPEDPGVTRRLLGMTYWGDHSVAGEDFTGLAHFGAGDEAGGIVPLENDEADRVAMELGLDRRDPEEPEQLGTTLLVTDPTVAAGDLNRAVERYWWPALMAPDLQFHVEIIDDRNSAGGGRLCPRPKNDPVLRSFSRAYEVATVPQDAARPDVRRHEFRGIGGFESPGVLGLVSEYPGWSHPELAQPDADADSDVDSDGIDAAHASLVALVRKPRMVVEYFVTRQRPPYVRGVFVADDSADEALRQTEPKLHDEWCTTAAVDVSDEHADLARGVLCRIKTHSNKFSRELKPKATPAHRLRLPEFDRIVRALLSGSGAGERPPRPEPRPFKIAPGGRLERAPSGLIRLTGTACVEFSEHYAGGADGDEVEVTLRYRFVEDDRSAERVELDVAAPRGFVDAGTDTYVGRLRPGEVVRFDYLSDEYSPDWTGNLLVHAELRRGADSTHNL